MNTAFGASLGSLGEVQVEDPSMLTPAEDLARVRTLLSELTQESPAALRIYRPRPTAAFSPRDTSHPLYHTVMARLQARGFQPGERGAGGQLAVYDEAALIVGLIAPHPEPRENTRDRYRAFSGLVADAFRQAGIDARVGEVPGEYCPGDYSVNAEGRVKLAGIAQRIGKNGYHIGAVLSVGRSDAAREAVTEAYELMGIPFDPASFGAMSDLIAMPSISDACRKIAETIAAGLRG
jgi:octanoyl-[GcvH]:protein N-octanoyltransferase